MTMKKNRSLAVVATVSFGAFSVANADAVGPVPEATAITGSTLCVVDGWEYAPRWSLPDNGFVSPSLEDCALDCEADASCTGATYIVSGSEKNCWFKGWGAQPVPPPCLPDNENLVYQAIIDPAGNACNAIVYSDEAPLDCDTEAEIESGADAVVDAAAPTAGAPEAAAGVSTVTDTDELVTLGYSSYPGSDYGPLQDPAPLVPIVDIEDGGLVAADAAECAAECDATADCNSASYYGDNPVADWPGGNNCYLKTIEGCELPADAEVTGDATIFLIGGEVCDGSPLAAAPALTAADMLPAAAPLADPLVAGAPAVDLGFTGAPVPALETTETATGPADVDTDDTRSIAPTSLDTTDETGDTVETPVEDTSAAVNVLGGCTAAVVAVVGAVVL